MISLIIIISLSFLPNIIYSSVPFVLNPGCNITQYEECNHTGLYYANHVIGNEAIHIFYSSLDDLTISMIQTSKDTIPKINYAALFSQNYTGAIEFPDISSPNSLSLIIRRLIQFNDENDDGLMNDDYNTTESYFLRNITASNITFQNNNTQQPTFQYPLDMINGTLNIDIVYPGEEQRDKKFPKLKTEPKSFFINIALQADNYTEPKTRFAFELYIASPAIQGAKMSSSRFIDDQFTPGIFNVWQLKTLGTLYPASMLWKPVVYLSNERTIEQNTLMQIYPLKNVSIDPEIDQGIFYSILPQPYTTALTISLGQAKDGFFSKTNYTFIQFTAGLNMLEPDSTKVFVSIALIVSLALPAVVAIIALIFILKRRFTRAPPSSYNAIAD